MGFSEPHQLATAVMAVISLVQSQLPVHSNYCFGLRTVLKIVELAHKKFTTETNTNENQIVSSCIDEILAKALHIEDIAEMRRILNKHFQGVDEPAATEKDLDQVSPEQTAQLILTEEMRGKIAEVRRALTLYTGIIITGKTYSGKTTILNLAASTNPGTQIKLINPKGEKLKLDLSIYLFYCAAKQVTFFLIFVCQHWR